MREVDDIDIRYRHEWKHEINHMDMLCIRQRLKAVAAADPHAKNGTYMIRSLYFDTPGDKALREKVDGVNRREKFRIRYYDGDTSMIKLEKKSRLNGLGSKYSAGLSKDEVGMLLRGDLSWMPDREDPLITELYCKMNYQQLRPKTIVDYKREPYIYGPGNVRVTFDLDIRTGMDTLGFLDPDCITIKAGDDIPIILEVKWDDYLPTIIKNCVQMPGRHVTAFSKYAQCRIRGGLA